jgi:hypothetical protein
MPITPVKLLPSPGSGAFEQEHQRYKIGQTRYITYLKASASAQNTGKMGKSSQTTMQYGHTDKTINWAIHEKGLCDDKT